MSATFEEIEAHRQRLLAASVVTKDQVEDIIATLTEKAKQGDRKATRALKVLTVDPKKKSGPKPKGGK